MRILLVYADRIGESMGGVGIRATELARTLREALGAEVTLAAAEHDGSDVGVPVVTWQPHAAKTLERQLEGVDAIVAQPLWPSAMRRLAASGARLVFDLYDPELFGTLEHFAGRNPRLRRLMAAFNVDRLTDALARADHVMCANERQRDLWIGLMMGAGLLTPATYDADPSLRSVLDVVAFGLPDEPPVPGGPGARATLGIAADAEVVLWNGGIWSWLDAATPIRAIARLRERRPAATLVFMGAGSTAAPAQRAVAAAREVTRSLGLPADAVRFHDGWVPYHDRAGWLLDADCAVYAHADHLESRFASRTRVLDCLWAKLPVVCTSGDEIADRIGREDLGAVVAPEDPDAMAAAFDDVLTRGRGAFADRLQAAASELTWDRVAQPLVDWLRAPAPPMTPLGRGVPRRPGAVLRATAYRAAGGALGLARARPPRAG